VAGFERKEGPGDDVVQAAARIFEEYGGFIRAVIRYQAHNRSEEEDLFQEFFLALIRKPVPADTVNLKSYLYQAVTHHVVDSIRRRANYRRAVRTYVRKTRIPINNRASGNASIENTEEKNAVIARFARHLQQREAQAFVLRYRDNFSIGEIASVMGVNVRTVSRYLSGALSTLRKTLAT
jgi:RNA polymerase sigma factor (sigma-70 family)